MRECLLLLGAAAVAGGRPVHEVEHDLRRAGAALGAGDVRVAATPTGVFVSLGLAEPAGFEPAGPALRFDQAAGVSRALDGVLTGALGPGEAVAALRAALAAPPRVPGWLRDAGLVPVAVGIALVLQPGTANVAAAAVGAVVVAALMRLAGRRALLQTLLPVVAAAAVGSLAFLAAEAGLLEGPLRTLLPPLAVLLPGALLVTGMSELAAGAMVAGTSRLVFGTVQLLLLALGVLAAARVVGVGPDALANVRVDQLGAAAPWVGVGLIGLGVFLNVSAPRGSLPWIWLLLLLAFGAQTGGQAAYGVPAGGFAGATVAALAAAVVPRLPTGPPALVVFLPAFWLLVPGSLGLLGTTALATDATDAGAVATGAVLAVVALALGVLVGSALGRSAVRTLDARGPRRPRSGAPPAGA